MGEEDKVRERPKAFRRSTFGPVLPQFFGCGGPGFLLSSLASTPTTHSVCRGFRSLAGCIQPRPFCFVLCCSASYGRVFQLSTLTDRKGACSHNLCCRIKVSHCICFINYLLNSVQNQASRPVNSVKSRTVLVARVSVRYSWQAYS